MDITSFFRECIEKVRIRNEKYASLDNGKSHNGSSLLNKSQISSKLFPKKRSEHLLLAKELLSTIKSLEEVLNETKAPYLRMNHFYARPSAPSSKSGPRPKIRRAIQSILEENESRDERVEILSESEKDTMEMNIEKIIKNSQKKISDFTRGMSIAKMEELQPQLFIHLGNVINSISEYLKSVCSSYAQMKAYRVKRTIDSQNMAKIHIKPNSRSSSQRQQTTSSSNQKAGSSLPFGLLSRGETRKENESSKINGPNTNSNIHSESESTFPLSYLGVEESLSPEEMQMFEEENNLLVQNLNTVADEVQEIESSVVQIAQLQEVFTEKVLLQDKEISQIANVVVGTTENIKGGNEQIRQAIQQNADFRAWLLFFIIVMSLTLLFLDWYND